MLTLKAKSRAVELKGVPARLVVSMLNHAETDFIIPGAIVYSTFPSIPKTEKEFRLALMRTSRKPLGYQFNELQYNSAYQWLAHVAELKEPITIKAD